MQQSGGFSDTCCNYEQNKKIQDAGNYDGYQSSCSGSSYAKSVEESIEPVQGDEKMAMENDMRIAKFEVLVDEIVRCENLGEIKFCSLNGEIYITAQRYLAAIYDYNRLNDYGKVVMRQAGREDELVRYKNIKEKIEALKELTNGCKESFFHHYEAEKDSRCKVIFWAMLILTVDDSDREEHLSLICDLARMLQVSDEEVMDMLQVIQVIYRKDDGGVKFLSKSIPEYFKMLLIKYGYLDIFTMEEI